MNASPRENVGNPGIYLLKPCYNFFSPGFIAKASLFALFLIGTLFSEAQSVSPSTMNATGHSVLLDEYQFEWSVGESTSIITTSNSNLVVTAGVLQSNTSAQSTPSLSNVFFIGEIRIYPNPTRDVVEINILHRIAGKHKLQLFDNLGRKLMEKQIDYNGLGMLEKWDLSRFTAGQYFLSIELYDPVNGGAKKKGAFRISKIK